MPPLSLYVHLPWCRAKCPYCDFNSHAAGDNAPRDRYVAALILDLATEAERAGDRIVESVFLGGGTPSFFSPEQIAALLDACRTKLALADDCEITMEANPGTVEHGNMAGYRQAGVTRLSLGGQSFDADALEALGRIHGPDEIRMTYQEAEAAGFTSINIDLMFALPGQDPGRAASDIDALLELAPPHVSYYQLTLEPNTVFYRQPPADLPDEDTSWAIQEHCHRLLTDAGYEQYEISAFAKPGHRCRHNLNYWTFGDYLAIGAGAHGKFTDDAGTVRRYRKPAHPIEYIEKAPKDDLYSPGDPVGVADLRFEFMLNVLRLGDGFSEADFRSRTGLDPDVLTEAIAKAGADGLIEATGEGVWRPTGAGFRFLNELQALFLP